MDDTRLMNTFIESASNALTQPTPETLKSAGYRDYKFKQDAEKTRARAESILRPILDRLEALPEVDGKKFHIHTSKQSVHPEYFILIEYRGKDENKRAEYKSKGIFIDFPVDPDKEVRITRFDIQTPDEKYPPIRVPGWGQPKKPFVLETKLPEAIVSEVGLWMGATAPDRVQEFKATGAAKAKAEAVPKR